MIMIVIVIVMRTDAIVATPVGVPWSGAAVPVLADKPRQRVGRPLGRIALHQFARGPVRARGSDLHRVHGQHQVLHGRVLRPERLEKRVRVHREYLVVAVICSITQAHMNAKPPKTARRRHARHSDRPAGVLAPLVAALSVVVALGRSIRLHRHPHHGLVPQRPGKPHRVADTPVPGVDHQHAQLVRFRRRRRSRLPRAPGVAARA